MSVQACAEITRRGDPDRFLAAMAAPGVARARLFPLYALNLEIARAPWVSHEPVIGEMRLQFWRDVLDEIGSGAAARAHEVAAPLHRLHGEVALPLAALEQMIDARRADLERVRFATPRALWRYLDAGAGSLMWAGVAALGGRDETRARALGRAAGLAAWLEAVPRLHAAGWRACDPGLYPEMIAEARTALAALRGHDFGPGTPAARTAWRAAGLLRRAAQDPARIEAGGLSEPEVIRRAGLIWRTLRRRW